MAIIGKIRKHAGITVGIIAVAMAGFILLQDQSGSGCSRNKRTEFAKIGKEKISDMEFKMKVEEQAELYRKQAGKENLSSAESFQVMISTWDQMVREMIMQKEYEELGLAVQHDKVAKPSISPEELYDLMLGKNLHPYIVQNFADPQTGVVNTQQIQQIIQNFEQLTDEEKAQWKMLEQAIKDERINTKYNTLVSQGYYLPKAFAEKLAEESNKTANIRFYGIKYQTISDSLITVSDDDFNKYYEAHKYEFEQDATVDIDYVIFDVLPSEADMKSITETVAKLYDEFKTLPDNDVDNFLRANSDAPYDSSFHKKGTLPVKIDSIMFSSPVGTIIEPYIDAESYYMARLMQIQDRPDSLKVSHILIGYKDAPNPLPNMTRTKEQAESLADSIMDIVKKSPQGFNLYALNASDFPQAKTDSGNIGWFADADPNYKFFFDSCYQNKAGDIKIIQSTMGFHVVKLDAKQSPVKKVKVAILKRDIKPSSETYDAYLAQASSFAGANRDAEAFNKSVAAQGINKRNAQYIREMDYTIPGIETARDIIRWAFGEETKKGMVSEQVFDAQGKYVVALLVEKREKGIAPLEQIKTYIEPLVKREKKAEQIINKIDGAKSGSNDIYQIASKLNVPVDTLGMLTFASGNLPNFGPEPELIGSIFASEKGSLSAPVKGKMAVYSYIVDDFVSPPASINPDMLKMQVMSYFRSRISNDVFRYIKDKTDIVDNRIFYY